MDVPQCASSILSPLETPSSSHPADTRGPNPVQVTRSDVDMTPLGSAAETGGGPSAPEDSTTDKTGADISAPERDAYLGAGNMGTGIDKGTIPEQPEQPQQQQQQQPPPSQPMQQQPQPQPTRQLTLKQTQLSLTPTAQQPASSRPQATPPVPPQHKILLTQKRPPAQAQPKKTASAAIQQIPATVLEPNPDRRLTAHPGQGTSSAGIQITAAGDSPVWGFATLRTSSGRSLGSLEHYSIDWNGADMSEVSSTQIHPTRHPAGPSALAQKMHALKAAVHEADKTAEVNIFFFLQLSARYAE